MILLSSSSFSIVLSEEVIADLMSVCDERVPLREFLLFVSPYFMYGRAVVHNRY